MTMILSTPYTYEEEGITLGDDPCPPPCDRCGGLTVSELMRDGVFASVGRRCILCGNIFDPVILQNRYSSLPL